MTSSLLDISSQVNSPRPNGLLKDFPSKPHKGVSFRPTTEQLSLIEAHNNEAIKTGNYGYLSDGGEDSGLEYELGGYRRNSIDLSSDSDSSSLSGDDDDDDDEGMKVKYEHYEPEMFEHKENKKDENKMNDESDDCNFGKSVKGQIMQEILHHGIDETSYNTIDDFGGWDVAYNVRNTKPSRTNIRRYAKTPRTNSAFPRMLTDCKDSSYIFKHYDDLSDYIKQYRQEQSVKDYRLKSMKDGEEGLLVPDPYASKLKSNMCSIAENCDFLTVYSSSTKEKVEKPKEKDVSKDKIQSIILPRPRPSSLVYCPTHDSDEDGTAHKRERPTSLIYLPPTDKCPVLPRLRPSSYVYTPNMGENQSPVIVTSLQRADTPVSSKEKISDRISPSKQRPSSSVQCRSDLSVVKQTARQQPRPFSDHPFVVRTLSIRDRNRMFNLAPVRNQDSSQKVRDVRVNGTHANISLDQYLNLVVPNRQLRRSNSNLTAHNLNIVEDIETKDQKPALHKKNIQLNLDGPCDPWTPKFEMKRTISRNTTTTFAYMTKTSNTNSAGFSRKKSTPTPDTPKMTGSRAELTLSRASTYHSHLCSQNETIDNRINNSNVQRVYGQRFRCCERIHALISSDGEESNKKSKDRHLKLSVDNLKSEKTNPVSFGSFGIRKGMSREDTSVSLSCMYKLKRERQRRFNLSLVK